MAAGIKAEVVAVGMSVDDVAVGKTVCCVVDGA